MTVTREISSAQFDTTRFGTLEVSSDKVIRFISGMPGFEDLRDFIILDHDHEGIFKWLQSVERPDVAFLMTDPAVYVQGYKVPMKKPLLESLGAGDDSAGLVTLVMVTVDRDSKTLSLRLKGPVVFNSGNMRAVQCIREAEDVPAEFTVKLD